jgi:hypothetical protein
MLLLNVVSLSTDYTALYPRRLFKSNWTLSLHSSQLQVSVLFSDDTKIDGRRGTVHVNNVREGVGALPSGTQKTCRDAAGGCKVIDRPLHSVGSTGICKNQWHEYIFCMIQTLIHLCYLTVVRPLSFSQTQVVKKTGVFCRAVLLYIDVTPDR